MKADAHVEAAIRGVMEVVWQRRGETDVLMSFWSRDADAVAIGTGASEVAVGAEEIEQAFRQQGAASDGEELRFDRLDVSASGDVAWLYAEVTLSWTVDGVTHVDPMRLTCVLEQRDGRWLLMQMHNSVADPRIAAGEIFPTLESIAVSVRADQPELPAGAQGGTVTILFSDIVDSTALNVGLGDTRYVEVLREHNAIVRSAVAAHGGHEVKNEGDGFMIVFTSARSAIECALETQRALRARNEDADSSVLVRMGLHTGEPIHESEDFFGTHVVLASRVASEAKGGEVLVSSLLRELLEASGDFRFEARAPVELKGLQGEHTLYAVSA